MVISIYILLGLLIGALELRRHRAGGPIDAMTVFNCAYFVLFVFVPINVLWLGADVVRQQYAYETFGPGDATTALALLFSYVLFCLGYWLRSPNRRRTVNRGQLDHFPLDGSAGVAKIIFFVGVLLTVIYAIQIGGIMEAISSASEVRSGEVVIESKYIGYRHLSQFSADAFVLFVAVILGKGVKKIKPATGELVFLFSALVFFVYYALTTAGRRPFIYPIILGYLVYSSLGGRLKKTSLAALALIFVIAGLGTMLGPVILSGNSAVAFEMANINNANWWALAEVAYDNATQGLADSYIHFVGAQKASLWQFGFLTDIVNLPRDFFPSQLFGFERTLHMYGDTTEYFTGHKVEDDMSGEEPLGLHGYLLVNFGYAGMFAIFFFLGLFYSWIHVRFRPADPKDAVAWLVYWWVVWAFFVYFREGVLVFVIKGQLTWWITIAFLLHCRAKQSRALRFGSDMNDLAHLRTN